jgi:hypothetical protein
MDTTFTDPFDALFNLQRALEARLESGWLRDLTTSWRSEVAIEGRGMTRAFADDRATWRHSNVHGPLGGDNSIHGNSAKESP